MPEYGIVRVYLAAGVVCSCCSHKPCVAAVTQFCQCKTAIYLNKQKQNTEGNGTINRNAHNSETSFVFHHALIN